MEQLCWKGPRGHGRQQAEHGPAVCHNSDKGHQHPGLCQQKPSHWIKGSNFHHSLSTCWTISKMPHLVLVFPIKRMKLINWSELSKGPPRKSGAGAPALWREVEGLGLVQPYRRDGFRWTQEQPASTQEELTKKMEPGSSQWYRVGGQHMMDVNQNKKRFWLVCERTYPPRGQPASRAHCPERLCLPVLFLGVFPGPNRLKPWATCSDLMADPALSRRLDWKSP